MNWLKRMIRKLVIWAFNKQTQQLRDIVGIDVNQYDYGYLIIMTKVQGTDRVKVIPIPPELNFTVYKKLVQVLEMHSLSPKYIDAEQSVRKFLRQDI